MTFERQIFIKKFEKKGYIALKEGISPQQCFNKI